MLRLLHLVILFLMSAVFLFSQEKVQMAFTNAPLDEVLDYVDNKTGYHIYFNHEQVKDRKVTVHGTFSDIDSLLNLVLKETGLVYSIFHQKQIYITTNSIKPFELSDKNQSVAEALHNENLEMTNAEKNYLQGRKPDVIKTLVVGNESGKKGQRFVNVRVNMRDAENGEPLIAASMFIEETDMGAVTDINGNLVISLVPGKRYTAKFSCLGMESKSVYVLPYAPGELHIELTPTVIAIHEVTVKAEQQQRLQGVNIGMEKMTMKSVKNLPTFMGEKDVIKISEFLPGVQTVGEGSGGVYIRGGNADQNLFYINGVPVYNTSHMFGFFSSFNATMVKDFTMYKGHIPASYGGRLSSIFEIHTRQGNRKKFSARGGISPVSADLVVEGPVANEKFTYVLSARSSYSNYILQQLNDPTLRNSNAGFNDVAAAFSFKIKETNRLKIFGYNSSDKFTLGGLSEYNYQNQGASVVYNHYFSPSLELGASAVMSRYNFGTKEYAEDAQAYAHDYQIKHTEGKLHLKWTASPKHSLEAGLNSIHYFLNRGKIEPFGTASIRNPLDLQKEAGLESSLFASELYTPTSWLSMYAGFRLTNYIALGPDNVQIYAQGAPLSNGFITDTLTFGANRTVKQYFSPEVRLSGNIRPWRYTSVKIAYNNTSQNLFMLSNTVAIAPNDQWKLADYHIKPAKAIQYSLGIFQEIPSLGLSTSVELYNKKVKNIVEYKDGADFISTANVEQLVLQGNQHSYGAEFMVKKNAGNFTGWISYTYSRSFICVDGDNAWGQINNGKEYPSNYDIPHSANLIANYKFSRRFSFSTNMVYKTGRPTTYPQSIYYLDGKQIIDYTNRNAYRIPDYFRVDASLMMEGNLKKDKFLHSTWMLSVYNLAGRKNPYSVYFKMEDGMVKGYKYSVIGVPIVTLKWIFKLGNYAAD